MKTYKDLEMWKMAVNLVVGVYSLTKKFPKEEIYGLSNQMRRAAVSVSSNIAEDAGRESNKDFI